MEEKWKKKIDFYGRTANPHTNKAPLYTHLKLDENGKNVPARLVLIFKLIRFKKCLSLMLLINF